MQLLNSMPGFTITVVVAVLLATACVSTPLEDDPSSVDETVLDEVFTATSVTRHDDGTVTITQRQVTLAEQIADREVENQRQEGLARGAIPYVLTQDGACSSSSLRLFDQSNYVGNVICFSGSGSTDLSAYSRTVVCNGQRIDRWYDYSWTYFGGLCQTLSFAKSNKVKSVRAGQYYGGFNSSSRWFSCSVPCITWQAGESIANLGTSASACRWVHTPYYLEPC
jgi:hypothetical protein